MPFSTVNNSIHRFPGGKKYPKNPQTIGEHIKKKRLEMHLSQQKVANLLNVSIESIIGWEHNRIAPHNRRTPLIIDFLGYNPYPEKLETLADKIKYYRLLHGLNHIQFGKLVDASRASISLWETNKHIPCGRSLKKINKLLSSLF